jgi:uncharacterized membrane protein YfcA
LEPDSAVVFVWAALAAAAFFAGVVDAVIGGGGMLQIPALFAFMPGVAPPPLLGTNKLASAIGTTGAAIQYARSVATPWRIVVPCMVVAFVASLAGAYAVTLIPAEPLSVIGFYDGFLGAGTGAFYILVSLLIAKTFKDAYL